MRKTTWASVVAVFLLAAMTNAARADFVEVAFSYRFQDGTTVSGLADGNLQSDGDRVIDFTNIQAVYSGSPDTPFVFGGWSLSISALSLSGTRDFYFYGFASNPDTATPSPNFGFSLSNESDVINAVNVGTYQTSLKEIRFPDYGTGMEAEPFLLSSYSAKVVPEPSSMVLTLVGFVGIFAFKRRYRFGHTRRVDAS